MRLIKIRWFKLFSVASAYFVSFLLVVAIAALFLVPDTSEIIANLGNAEMYYALKLSVLTGTFSTLMVMLFAIPIGYALSRFQFPLKGFVKTILDLPIAFPELVLGLCLLLLFGNTFVGSLFKSIGLHIIFTKHGIIVAQFFTGLPYAIRILTSTFDYVDQKLEFVSRSLGYSMWETFCNVSLPMAKHGILAAMVIAFARCIGAFGTVLVLAGGTYMKTEVLPTALYLNISYGNMDMAITCGIVLTAVSFTAVYFFEKAEVAI